MLRHLVIAFTFIVMMSTLAFMPACTSNTDPTTAAYWIDKLEDKAQRQEAIAELGKMGDKTATPHLLKWFDKKGDWQPTAAYALGELGNPEVTTELIQAIDFQVGAGRDGNSRRINRVNANIARALAMLKAKRGVAPLLNLLTTEELKTRVVVIESLGKLGDASAAKELIALALNEPQPFVRKTAIMALGNLGSPDAIPALIQMLYIPLPGTSFYYEARFSLIQIGSASVMPLIATMERKNKEVEAIRLPGGDKIAEGAIEAKAGFALGALRAKIAEPVMIRLLEGFYKKVQGGGTMFASLPGAVIELAYSLGNLGTPKAVPILQEMALSDDANLRGAAADALVSLGAKSSASTLVKACASGNKAAKLESVRAAAMLGDAATLVALDKLASADADVKAILATERAVLEAATICKGDVACWTGKISDANSKVRSRAVRELTWSGKDNTLPLVFNALKDQDGAVRVAALGALHSHPAFAKLSDDDRDAMKALYKTSKQKIEYKDSAAALRRLLARSKSID